MVSVFSLTKIRKIVGCSAEIAILYFYRSIGSAYLAICRLVSVYLWRFMADSENNQDKLAFFHRFRRNPVRIAFFRLIFVPLADALDAPARQCSNKFDIALAYSYLWLTPKILRLGIIKHECLLLRSTFRIFDFVLDTPSRHNQADACFCARLFVSLTSSKILSFGNVQINLTLHSLIRIVG